MCVYQAINDNLIDIAGQRKGTVMQMDVLHCQNTNFMSDIVVQILKGQNVAERKIKDSYICTGVFSKHKIKRNYEVKNVIDCCITVKYDSILIL